jgi:glutaredoxin-like protein NrdH
MDEQEGTTPMGAHITLYTEPGTPAHKWATHALQRTGRQFELVDVTADPEALSHIRALGYEGPPVIEVGDQHWPGNDPEAIRSLIEYLKRPRRIKPSASCRPCPQGAAGTSSICCPQAMW